MRIVLQIRLSTHVFCSFCFESVRGNDTNFLVHLRSDLDILRQYNGSVLIKSTGGEGFGPRRRGLIHIFSQMDNTCTVYLDEKASLASYRPTGQSWHPSTEPEKNF